MGARLMVSKLSTIFCWLEWQTERTFLMRPYSGKQIPLQISKSSCMCIFFWCVAFKDIVLDCSKRACSFGNFSLLALHINFAGQEYGGTKWDWVARWEGSYADLEYSLKQVEGKLILKWRCQLGRARYASHTSHQPLPLSLSLSLSKVLLIQQACM